MFDKAKLLGISVSGFEEKLEPPAPAAEDMGNPAFWIVILIAIVIVCLILSKYLPIIIESSKEKKRKNAQEKIENKRNEELERLHKIKEKNKRK